MVIKSYFLSDLHLGSLEEPKSQLFLNFLRSFKNKSQITHLFLVGDIFDLWLGKHKYFIAKYQQIIDEIVRLKDLGVEIIYFEGNHDLYLKWYWEKELGIQVYTGPHIFDWDGIRLRVEHGDQMDPEDRGYIFLRWFLRTPLMKCVARWLPGPVAAWIGEKASHSSRDYTSNKKTITKDRARDKIRTHSEEVNAIDPCDLHIHGHVHLRDDHSFEVGSQKVRSVNLGSWLTEPGYFYLESEGDDVSADAMSAKWVSISEQQQPWR